MKVRIHILKHKCFNNIMFEKNPKIKINTFLMLEHCLEDRNVNFVVIKFAGTSKK